MGYCDLLTSRNLDGILSFRNCQSRSSTRPAIMLVWTLLVLRDLPHLSTAASSLAVTYPFYEHPVSSSSQAVFFPHLHLKRTRHGLQRAVRQPSQEPQSSNARLTRIKHYVLRRLQNKHGPSTRDVGLDGIIPDLLPEADNQSVRVTDTASFYGNSYIPYRYRCQTSGHCSPRPAPSTERSVTLQPPRHTVPPCTYLRWNHELPFSELPNLVFSLLAFDMISGHTLTDKSRFLSILLEAGTNAYMTTNSSAGVFEVPNAIDATTCSIKRSVEPLIDSLHQLLNMYTSRDQRLLLALVQAAKACRDKLEGPAFPLELLPCLDFSFGQEQLLDLVQPRSIFGNRELCRKHLRHNISLCLPTQPHSCNEKQLFVLRNFARTYYKCASSVPTTVQKPGVQGSDDLTATDEDEFELQMAQEKSSAAFSRNLAHSCAFLTNFLLTKFFVGKLII